MYELVNFIEEYKADYSHFILTGDLQNLTLSLYPIPGSRVVLDRMLHDPDFVPSGTVGIVEGYDDDCLKVRFSCRPSNNLWRQNGARSYKII